MISAAEFAEIATGVSALVAAISSVVGTIYSSRNYRRLETVDRKTEALGTKTQEIKVSLDGRLDQFMASQRGIADAQGASRARSEGIAATAAAAFALAARDDRIVTKVADAVVQHISGAVELAVQAAPVEPKGE